MIASTVCQEDTIDDIEDLTTLFEQPKNTKMKETNGPKVIIRQLQNTKHLNEEEENKEDVDTESLLNLPSSIVPGCATIYVKTWGCTHNSSDSEYMAGQLASYGYKITDDKLKADLWLLNSCTVKAPAEDHFRNEIKAAKELNKYIVLAGCVPQASPNSDFIEGFSVIGVQQIDRVVEVVEETLKGNSVRFLGQKKENGRKMGGASLSLPKIRRNPLIEIIAVNTGCLNQCTYCKTKHARGKLGSYPPIEIVDRAEQAFYEGVCELWLTSEDTGAYGLDIGTNLPELLWQIIEVIPDNCRMRIGMTNPPYILEHLEEICKILNHPKVYSFLHIPVQSGSDQVLIDMKREYTRAEFEKVVDFIKERVPGVTIATDIICGFPTETEQDFEDTMDLCKKYKFPSLFINQFFPRPGTPAAKMVKIPTQLVKQRTKRLSEFFQSYEPYAHKIGEIQKVLVTEISHDQKYYVGHNKFYEQVLVPMKKEYMGKMITVKITETSKYSMKGEPLILIIYWCRFIDYLKIFLSIFNLNNFITLVIIIAFAIFLQVLFYFFGYQNDN